MGEVVQDFNTNTQQAETGRYLNVRPAWSTEQSQAS